MLSILFSLIAVAKSASLKDERDAEFTRIKQYELVYFNGIDIDSIETSNTFEFDLSNQHYKLELTLNKDMHVRNVRHTSIDINKLDEHFSQKQLTKSCHYSGRVINTDNPSLTSAALSFCDKRGVRGRITAFNKTIIIYPSAYFLDKEKDSKCDHKLTDQHLIYKLSDFDTTNIGRAGAISTTYNHISNKIPEMQSSQRRRLYNNGLSETEMLIVSGPERTKDYQSRYGANNWYSQMYNDYASIINQVSTEYMTANWGSTVGQVNVKFVELEIISAFTGKYLSLKPDFLYTNCRSSFSSCNINGRTWLSYFRTWISNYKDVSTFDNAQLISNIEFTPGYAGWGNIGVVCRGSSSVSNAYVGWGTSFLTRTIAHELGHNFGMEHDGQGSSTCGANDGLMGYGDGEGFSSCSITALRQYFAGNGGLTCLGRGYYNGKFTSNHNDDVNPAPTQRPTIRPTTRPTARPTTNTNPNPTPRPTARPTTRSPTTGSSGTDDDWECVGLRNFGLDTYNGYWSYVGEYPDYSGKPYYENNANGAFIYYHPYYKFYLMSTIVGSISVFGYCSEDDIKLCLGNNAFKYADNGQWVADNDAEVYDCTDDTGTGDGDCENYECLSIVGMYPDKYGRSYDGKWEPAGCHNGQSVYIQSSDTSSPPSRYLCYSEYYDLWIISNELCGTGAFAYCPDSSATDILKTANKWNIATNSGWGRDSQVYFSDCGGFGGYLDEQIDLSCIEENKYNEKLCITTANDTVIDDHQEGNDTMITNVLWNGNRTFEIYTKQCSNNKPIYYYADYTLIEGEDVFGNINQENVESIYYLHYHKELLYSDSNITYGQWIISKDEISINAIAVCEKMNYWIAHQIHGWLIHI